MNSNTQYKTIKIPFFNNFEGFNNFDIIGNKLIAEQQIKENSKSDNNLISIEQKITTLRYEFNLPENITLDLDFESDVTITYEVKENELYLVNIDALYAGDYIENIESNINVYPILKNGYIDYICNSDETILDTAC